MTVARARHPAVSPVRATADAVDASCRGPVLTLVALAVGWLAIAGGLGVVGAIQRHAPGFLAGHAWLTYGRVQPAAETALVLGFALPAGWAIALWLVGHGGGATLAGGRSIVVATLFWNLGFALGLIGLLAGAGSGIPGIELPSAVLPVLGVTAGVVMVWLAVNLHRRHERELSVPLWFVLGCVAAFPWLLATAARLNGAPPLRGVVQTAAAAWFAQNLATFMLALPTLAALFHFLPQMAGAALPSRSLAGFGFWTLVLVGGASGMNRFHGGPFPAWMISVGVVASVLAIMPTLAVARNLLPLCRCGPASGRDQAWLFLVVATAAFTLGGLLNALNALDVVRRVTQFTLVTPALEALMVQGFVGFALIGAIYLIVPRLLGRDWPSRAAVRFHVLAAVAGLSLLVMALGVGGIVQGRALADPAVPFLTVVRKNLPFLGMATLANLLLLAGNLALAGNLFRLLVVVGRERWGRFAQAWFAPLTGEET
jgi:cytochrome c oxidase cbb3-type subunit 1